MTTAVRTDPTIAIDLGGTHVRAAVVDADGTVTSRVRRSTPHDQPTPAFIADLVAEVSSAASVGGERAPDRGAIQRAVVGVPGVIDYDAEQLIAAPNLPQAWIPMLSDAWLAERTGVEIALANDADLAAVGESNFGAGVAVRDVVYVTVSTGVGAGIVLGHRLMRGRYSGGEIGHSVIDRGRMARGEDGTVEYLGSGTAMARLADEAGLDAAGAELAALVADGDPRAVAVWNDAIEAVAVGVVNLCWLVTPQMIVIGGGVGMNSDLVLPIIKRRVAEFGPTIEPIQIVPAKLGDDAALSGAAAWWKAIGRDL